MGRFFDIVLIAMVCAFVGFAAPAYALSDNEVPTEVAQALAAPEQTTLYSLSPGLCIKDGQQCPEDKNKELHRYPILGKILLNSEQTKIATQEFQKAISNWDPSKGLAMCFNPRHGLRLVSNKHTYDLVLCYECQQIQIFKDDEPYGWLGAYGSPDILNILFKDNEIPFTVVPPDNGVGMPPPSPPLLNNQP